MPIQDIPKQDKVRQSMQDEIYALRREVMLQEAEADRMRRLADERHDELISVTDRNIELRMKLERLNEIVVSMHGAWRRCVSVIEMIDAVAKDAWVGDDDETPYSYGLSKHLKSLSDYINKPPRNDSSSWPFLTSSLPTVMSNEMTNTFEELSGADIQEEK